MDLLDQHIEAERKLLEAILLRKPDKEIAELRAEKDRLWKAIFAEDKARKKREAKLDLLGPGCHH